MRRQFKKYNPDQEYLLPPPLKEWLPENHLCHFVSELVEQLDISEIVEDYESDGWGQSPYNPLMMTELILYAYCAGQPSLRKIEKRTYEDIAFRYLAAGNFPDHDTICEFRKRHCQERVMRRVRVPLKTDEKTFQLWYSSFNMNEQLEFIKEIARRLDSVGIPYMMTGSMALALYARPRMTRDIDLVIECQSPDSETIVSLFERDCYVDEQEIRDAIASRTMFNIIHNEWIIKADFIVRKNNEYRRLEFDRRRRFTIEGVSIWGVSPEDLILSKLYWAKDGNSELQREDVRAMLQTAHDLDWIYLEQWAEDLRVQELLSEMRE